MLVLLTLLLLSLRTAEAMAHGGGLDAQGCHTNSKTSERHCHHNGGRTSNPKADVVSGLVSVISVGDGDTIRVISRQGEKVTIRLACIDAPETSQGTSGKWSTQHLKRLIEGKAISLKPQVKDRYGRTVAEIYVGNRNINLQMVRDGAAYAYRKYLKQCDRDVYLQAEDAASKRKAGVWGPYKPSQLPWNYRRSRRS